MLKLTEAFLTLKTAKDVQNFLLDILTPQEFRAMKTRWEVANLLLEDKMSYIDIAKKANTSTGTVTRVNRFLHNGYGGYQKALEKE